MMPCPCPSGSWLLKPFFKFKKYVYNGKMTNGHFSIGPSWNSEISPILPCEILSFNFDKFGALFNKGLDSSVGKGQLISKGLFAIFNWTKKRTKYFSISALKIFCEFKPHSRKYFFSSLWSFKIPGEIFNSNKYKNVLEHLKKPI